MSEPKWGLVSAEAHEHLLLIRNGTVVRAQQGGSVWKWPSDTVARIDTSVHRLRFTADQITRERVGVQVTGLAVFRVVAPEVAYRMLDLRDPERHQAILEQMFVGATRRLVATLSLDDCLTRRKDALAAELMSEVAPVVGGRGQPGDATDRGWGVAIDTIEIQDVRVLSAEVFEQMQAPFRAQLSLQAVRAQAEVAAAQARVAAEAERAAEARRAELFAHEQARIEAERARARDQVEHDAALQRAAQEAALRRAAEVAEAERERGRLDAAAQLERQGLEAAAGLERQSLEAAARLERERRAAEEGVETARLAADARRLTATAASEATRLERAALDSVSEARLRELLLTQTGPEMARALRGSFSEIQITPDQLGGLIAAVRAAFG